MTGPSQTDSAGSEPAKPLFSAERTERAGAIVIALHGELDVSSAGRFLEAAADVGPGSRLILDLSGLDFIDSAGLRSLMNLDLRARAEDWEFALAAPAPTVMRLLKLTGFEQRLAILDAAP